MFRLLVITKNQYHPINRTIITKLKIYYSVHYMLKNSIQGRPATIFVARASILQDVLTHSSRS